MVWFLEFFRLFSTTKKHDTSTESRTRSAVLVGKIVRRHPDDPIVVRTPETLKKTTRKTIVSTYVPTTHRCRREREVAVAVRSILLYPFLAPARPPCRTHIPAPTRPTLALTPPQRARQ